ncbi:MAG: DUF6314 family protein [Pseudomonadota bacterium]
MKDASFNLFNLFNGRWAITRGAVNNTTNKTFLRAKGEARFSFAENNSNRLKYDENLKIIYKDYYSPINGRQSYVYDYDEDSNVITKHFSDGRVFYVLNTLENTITGSHICDMDIYKAKYLIINQTNFIASYTVLGPHKDYTITTIYSKVYEGY